MTAPAESATVVDLRQIPLIAEPHTPSSEEYRAGTAALSHQLHNVILQFLQSTEPRGLQDRTDKLTKQLDALAEKAFAELDLDPQRYQLNVDRGEFIGRTDKRTGGQNVD